MTGIVCVDRWSERQLIDAGRDIESRQQADKWELGKVASVFVTINGHGSDQQFAELIGSQQQRVNECRRVFEDRESYRSSGNLSWTHLRVSLSWADFAECLDWADGNEASVNEMMAWRRLKHGEDITAQAVTPAANLTAEDVPEPDPDPIAKPKRPEPASAEQPAKAPQPQRAAEQSTPAPTPAPQPAAENIDARILSALSEISRQITDVQDRKSIAAKFRAIADKLDPPEQRARFVPPTISDVKEHAAEKGWAKFDAEKFVNHYGMKGWKVGKSAMKNWRLAAANAWENGTGWCAGAGASAPADGRTRERDWSKFE